jgi:hypothetical protein
VAIALAITTAVTTRAEALMFFASLADNLYRETYRQRGPAT